MAEKKTDVNPLTPFAKQIADLILKPYVVECVEEARKAGTPIQNEAQLHEAFRAKTGSTVSSKKFGEWLQVMEVSVTQRIDIKGLS